MNERIKQLAIDCAGQLEWDGFPKDPESFTFSCHELEKFAMLLVRECAMKANATALDLRNRPELDARKYVGDCILKCFGVEE